MVARWSPFTDVARMFDDMDRFLSEVRPTRPGSWLAPIRPAIDLYDAGENLVLKAMMPGVTPEELEVSIEQNTLHIGGAYGYELDEEENKQATWYRREIGSGRFTQDVTLPMPVEADRVEATFEGGILTLRLPKAEQARAKRIEVKAPRALSD